MTTPNEHGSILFDVAKIKHSWDSPDSYGVDALWNQFHRQETDGHAKAYTFTRGPDSVTVTFKTFYKLMSRYRNCAAKYNSYDVPMYTPEQIAAGVHGRLWMQMSEDGHAMQIKLAQAYLGTKEHTILDERDKLAPAPLPEAVTLPCGWYAEAALRHALQLTTKQITAVRFTTDDGHQVLIDKKLLAAFLRPATGMHLEYRLKLDNEAYQMDAGTQSTYDGNKAITLKPLPASLRIEYRSQGYKGVARLGDSHLPPPDPSAVLTVSVPAVPHYTVAPLLDYQQPTLLDVVEEPAPIPIPEPATIPRDSDRATAAGVAYYRSLIAEGYSISTSAHNAHVQARQHDRATYDRAALNDALDAISDEEIAALRPAPVRRSKPAPTTESGDSDSVSVSEPEPETIPSDSMPIDALYAPTPSTHDLPARMPLRPAQGRTRRHSACVNDSMRHVQVTVPAP